MIDEGEHKVRPHEFANNRQIADPAAGSLHPAACYVTSASTRSATAACTSRAKTMGMP